MSNTMIMPAAGCMQGTSVLATPTARAALAAALQAPKHRVAAQRPAAVQEVRIEQNDAGPV